MRILEATLVLSLLAVTSRSELPSVKVLPQSPAGTASRPSASGRRTLENVVIVGASISAGFQEFGFPSHPLSNYLTTVVAGAGGSVSSFADSMFFLGPSSTGPRQVQSALAKKPSLVIAVDFLFWYGYGDLPSDEDRLALLDKGLAELAKFSCPILVGDIPDVSPGIGKMIRASQVPSKEGLAKLNAHLTKWAAAHKDVTVVPFTELLPKLYKSEPFTAGENRWAAGESSRLVHKDLLHLTEEGTAALAVLVIEQAKRQFADVQAEKLETNVEKLVKSNATSRPASSSRPASGSRPASRPVK